MTLRVLKPISRVKRGSDSHIVYAAKVIKHLKDSGKDARIPLFKAGVMGLLKLIKPKFEEMQLYG